MDGDIILFYSWLSVGYQFTQHADTICNWPTGKSGERFDSLEKAKTGCTNLPGCTMFYQYGSFFKTCPLGSTVKWYQNATLYTAIGKFS